MESLQRHDHGNEELAGFKTTCELETVARFKQVENLQRHDQTIHCAVIGCVGDQPWVGSAQALGACSVRLHGCEAAAHGACDRGIQLVLAWGRQKWRPPCEGGARID